MAQYLPTRSDDDTPAEPSFCVMISPRFITPHPLEVIINKCPCGKLVIKDSINNQILVRVKQCDTKFHRQRLLLDANDKPIVMLKEKKLSIHKHWDAFRGKSTADSHIIFSTKIEHVIYFNTHIVSVILGNGDSGLKIQGSLKNRNCTIGDSSTTIAQMNPLTLKKMKSGEDEFTVTIQSHMDYAFVVALFAIVDAMENPSNLQGSAIALKLATGVAGLALNVIASSTLG